MARGSAGCGGLGVDDPSFLPMLRFYRRVAALGRGAAGDRRALRGVHDQLGVAAPARPRRRLERALSGASIGERQERMITATQARSGKSHRDENFPVASRLIRARHRGPILAFYRFVRAADDVADHPALTPDEKLALLDRLEAALAGRGPADPEADAAAPRARRARAAAAPRARSSRSLSPRRQQARATRTGTT